MGTKLTRDHEIARKDERRIEKSRWRSGSPGSRSCATSPASTSRPSPPLDPKQIRDLASGRFIANGETRGWGDVIALHLATCQFGVALLRALIYSRACEICDGG